MRSILFLGAATGLALSLSPCVQAQTAPVDPPSAQRALNGIPNLSDDMIDELARRVRRLQDGSERASNPPIARPLNRLVVVSLRPGDPSAIINTVRGYPTSVTFTDNTGRPWPIHWENLANASQPGSTDCNNAGAQASNAGNGAAIPGAVFSSGFDVCVPVKGGNTLMITAHSAAPRGGLQVMLEGAAAPIPFTLMGMPDSYDSVVSVKVAQRGPNARVDMFTRRSGGPVTGDVDLSSMLDGTPPANARPLLVRGAPPDGIQAWELGGHMYVRTSATILSPQPIARQFTNGDLGIFEIPASPVVLATAAGQTFSIRLDRQEH